MGMGGGACCEGNHNQRSLVSSHRQGFSQGRTEAAGSLPSRSGTGNRFPAKKLQIGVAMPMPL